MNKRSVYLVAMLVALAVSLALAACGGGGSSSSSTVPEENGGEPAPAKEAGSGGETSEGGEKIVQGPSETPPKLILQGLEPLPEPPPKGVNVVALQCDFPTCEAPVKALNEAAKSLGWNVKTIVFKTGSPQSALTNALNIPGTEFIYGSGISQTIVEPQIKQAEEKGIKIVDTTNPEPPRPPAWPVEVAQLYTAEGGEGMAEWIINDSGGKAKVAFVGLPEVAATAAEPPVMEKIFAEHCPECTFKEIPVTGEELASGTVPAKVVAFLQSNPEIDYVDTAFGNLLTGVPQAIKSAGLAEKVKITSKNGLEAPEAEMLAKGEVVAFNIGGEVENGPMAIDAMARIAEGVKLPQSVYKKAQHWLCTPETVELCKNWVAPPHYLEQFEKLWGVG